MTGLVSVIILSYNHVGFIENTIKSILNQSYKNIEIIVIDDGSTDDSVVFLQKLRKEIEFKLVCKENGGVVSAINFGIQEANGDYIVLHACDDISLPNRVTNQIEVFLRYPETSFISSNINLVNKEGIYQTELLKRKKEKIINIDDAILGADISSVGCMYNAKHLKSIVLDESYIAEDPQIHLLLLSKFKYAIVDYGEPILNYYLNPKGLMNTKFEQLTLQNLRLLKNYKDNKNFKKAYTRVQLSYLSLLSETSNKQAFNYLYKNINLISERGINRVMIKIFLPKKIHYFFKKNRV